MHSLSSFIPQAEQIADLIDSLMLDELHLAAPVSYELNARGERVYLVASYDPSAMGRSLRVYEHPEVARRLRMVIGKPVTITRETGTRYVVLMHGALSLPKIAKFPFGSPERDVFKLGVGLKGERRIAARDMLNVIIVASQGSGKSSLLELLSYQMLVFGWQLYLADPQQHTFSPGLWNERAMMPVAGSHNDMLKLLAALEGDLATRVLLFQQAAPSGRPPKDIDAYNALGIEPLPRIGFVSDETNYYLGNKSIFHRFAELLREGRKYGLHIVAAAHDWHKKTIDSGVNDLFATRIALNSLAGAVVLHNHHWGKWVEGRPPGRGVLKTNKFEPMQFYLVGEEAEIQEMGQARKASQIPEHEADLVQRSLAEVDGKMTTSLLIKWGMSERDARELADRYEAKGWLAKDPQRGNARFVTTALLSILVDSRPNAQTVQTVQTAYETVQTGVQTASKPVQTLSQPVQTEDLSRSEL
jgi:hypothetical protein